MKNVILFCIIILIAPLSKGQTDSTIDILHAFHFVEVSMNKSGNGIDKKNKNLLDSLAVATKKSGIYYHKAMEADKVTSVFISYVDSLKTIVELVSMGSNDDIENHSNLLINQKKGLELKNRINNTREDLLNLLDASDRKSIQSDLIAMDNPRSNQSWESELFEHAPSAAVITLLTKIKNDAFNTEAQVLMAIAKSIDKSSTTFDKVEAIIIPKSVYVISGGKFEADIKLVAYDSKQSSDVIVNGRTIKPENGVAKYEAVSAGEGEQTVRGYIDYKDEKGTRKLLFETTFNVFKGGATIYADKMNVLYIGLDNPISIAVPGYTPEKVTVTMAGGLLSKVRNTSYIAKVTTRGEATISVSVKNDDGSNRAMGSMRFRVRNIPTPVATFGTIMSGDVQPVDVIKSNATRIYGSLGDGFAFEGVKYTVVSYDFLFVPKEGQTKSISCTGEELPEEVQKIIAGINSGDKIIFDRVKATGPDGSRNLSPIVITAL